MIGTISNSQDVMLEMLRQKEVIIMEQLNELLSRKLLVIEQTEPVLVQTFENGENKVELRQGVRLVLKDQEYIEQLEKENEQLKKRLQEMAITLQKS